MRRVRVISLALALGVSAHAGAQALVQDIFGRDLNQRGLTLVDWDGYLANPLLKFYLFAPTNAALPASATLSANGARLYFDSPSRVSPTGPSKDLTITSASDGVPFWLSIFPDRDSSNETCALSIVFTGADKAPHTNTIPIHLLDLDQSRPNLFPVLENFDRDSTGFFTNSLKRLLVRQAAEDWAYFFDDMRLDPTVAGTETTYIWSNNFNGGYSFTSTNTYTGYQLYAYGTTNAAHRSGGEGSYSGPVQTSGGQPLTIKRSGGFEAEIYGNYNTLGWLLLTNDDDWLSTGNYGNETNDFYSIAHHEIGHALIFNSAHPGFSAAKARGAFTSAAVTNYYGGPVPIDSSDHLNGAIDPESGQGAFGYEYYGRIPRKRWLITRLDLLCAQEVGYTLRQSSTLAPFVLPVIDPVAATATLPFQLSYSAFGGIPVYDWEIIAGALPPGLTLDRFTGAVSGTPMTSGNFSFTLRVRDYHEGTPGLTRPTAIFVAPAPPVRLEALLSGAGANAQVKILLHGTSGQRQVLESSDDLLDWTPVATNTTGTNLFEVVDPNPSTNGNRFLRAIVIP